MSDLVIHAVAVGGGILALAPLPGRGGAYAADMAHLRDWRPALVITLATRVELVAHGAERLGGDVQAMGARWAHLPVERGAAPDAAALRAWPALSARARAALKGGGRVLVHGLEGCGRPGMAALRLMVETGAPPDAALARLRHVLPCAVETPAQRDWAMAGADQGGALRKG